MTIQTLETSLPKPIEQPIAGNFSPDSHAKHTMDQLTNKLSKYLEPAPQQSNGHRSMLEDIAFTKGVFTMDANRSEKSTSDKAQNESTKSSSVEAQISSVVENDRAREITETASIVQTNEQEYLKQNSAKWEGLESRYIDNRTDMLHVQQEISDHAQNAGLTHLEAPELVGRALDESSRDIIKGLVQTHIDRLLNSDDPQHGRRNVEKHKTVTQQTERYLQLVLAAQNEGDMPKGMTAEDVLHLVEQNVWTLAYQDRVASENLLGDHGIRHLVGHNIHATETMFDALEQNGQTVKAVDRLVAQQTMIDHDLGYAMAPVRLAVNSGNMAADRGHNLLAAQYERKRLESGTDALVRVFTPTSIATIHEGILHHDSANVDFKIGDPSAEARQENIHSAIHVADNTHAFESKLPELLYSHADTLRIMRLMKTAGEIGNHELFNKLQADLVQGIQSADYSDDDKIALTQAAQSVAAGSYKFNVGRICGNNPTYTIDSTGKLTISVEESAIHQEVVGVYGQPALDQLRKFVADLTGLPKSEVDLNKDSILSVSGKMEIKINSGNNRAELATSDYQRKLEQLVEDPALQTFLIGDGTSDGDAFLSVSQLNLEKKLASLREDDPTRAQLQADIDTTKAQRKKLLENYLNPQAKGSDSTGMEATVVTSEPVIAVESGYSPEALQIYRNNYALSRDSLRHGVDATSSLSLIPTELLQRFDEISGRQEVAPPSDVEQSEITEFTPTVIEMWRKNWVIAMESKEKGIDPQPILDMIPPVLIRRYERISGKTNTSAKET